MTDIMTSNIWFEMNVTQKPSWDDISIHSIGQYKIYIFTTKISEKISESLISYQLPAPKSSSTKPITNVVKLNRIKYTVMVSGTIKPQTAVISGSNVDIDSKTAKLYLIDLFRMYQQPKLHWSGFNNNEQCVMVDNISFDDDSKRFDNKSDDTNYDPNAEIGFSASFTVGTRKNVE